ncbi:MAG: EcsC family protein, partial [Geobacteraceae bacterium]|nr:EcsC family protein [Geobacteraceae bacterium]
MALSYTETSDLRVAKALLENPGIAAKFSNFVGSPIEKGFKKLPESWSTTVNDVAKKSIETALDIALLTMNRQKQLPSSNWWHKLAVVATGAGGGAFGLPALAIELPVSTTIILRSIADIARSEGEDLSRPDAKLQCVQVLALGGKSKSDDGTESGYFVTRAARAKAVSEAASHLTTKGLS